MTAPGPPPRPSGHALAGLDAMAVRVGPPTITIHADEQYLVSDPTGEVNGERAQGYFVSDTRLVSGYRISLQDRTPILLNSSAVQPFSARYEMTNPTLDSRGGVIHRETIHLRLDRTISSGLHEDYELTNYGPEAVELELALGIECDFADVLEVRRGRPPRRGSVPPTWDPSRSALDAHHVRGGFRRGLRVQVERSDTRPAFAGGKVVFGVSLDPHSRWRACLLWMPVVAGQEPARPERGCHELLGAETERDRVRRHWLTTVTEIETDDDACNHVVRRSVDDLVSMRITRFDVGAGSETAQPEGWVPAAGIPWFLALFGRDPLVLAHQTFVLSPRFALAILQSLANFQGDRYDDARDLQPGKILHELRRGEAARLGIAPPSPYYGTHDATSLFVWLAAETWRWLGDRAPIERMRPHVERALQWIDRDGDPDGDGLQEYRTRAGEHGSYNQGWKDSGDAIVHEDGSRAPLPLATCELQGYVVAAKRGWARVLDECLGDQAGARRLREEADRLADRIETTLWWDEEGTYYLGLDGDKRPIRSVASNAGHLLWAGAVAPERAAGVVRRLLAEDMWSGWGVRTLSARHPAYNPFSYQRGSIWPHDNGILAMGCRRYGHMEPVWSIARALLDAAACFQFGRLPELFAGLDRDRGAFPVQYPEANAPQAWAAGSILHLLHALLGLDPDARARRLVVRPSVPPWLGRIRLNGLRVGDERVHVVAAGERVEGRSDGALQLVVRD